jgi:hypothetical protein
VFFKWAALDSTGLAAGNSGASSEYFFGARFECGPGYVAVTDAATGAVSCSVGAVQVTNPVATHSLKAPGLQPSKPIKCAISWFTTLETYKVCDLLVSKFAFLSNSTSCCYDSACPAGLINSKDTFGQLVCRPCPLGENQPDAAQTACLGCAAGTFNPITGQSACATCPMNDVALMTSSARSVTVESCFCKTGTFANNTGGAVYKLNAVDP